MAGIQKAGPGCTKQQSREMRLGHQDKGGVLLLHGHCFHQYRLKMPDSLRTSAKGLAIEDLRERTADVF